MASTSPRNDASKSVKAGPGCGLSYVFVGLTKLIMSNFLVWGTHCNGQFRMPSKIVAVATDLCPAVLGTRLFARVLGG